MKRFSGYVRSHWRRYTGAVAAIAALAGLLTYRLGSLTANLSPGELQSQRFAGDWHHLLQNSLLLPMTSLQWLSLRLFGHGAVATRLPSVVIGLLSIVAFAYVLRRWYGPRTAALGTVVFASSAWLLHVSRVAGPEVVYLAAIPVLFAVAVLWEQRLARLPVNYLAAVVLAALIYVPGMVWLIVLYFGLQSQLLRHSWQQLRRPWRRASVIALFWLLLTPLAYSLARHHDLVSSWLGMPARFGQPAAVGHRLIHSVSFFVWRGPLQPELWLDRLPVISLFATAMLLLGGYFYGRHLTASRSRLLIGLFVLAAVFYSLGGAVCFSILVPVVYLVVTGGIGYLLHEWLRTFPRNPVARASGYTLVSLLIVLSGAYNLRAYFVAWPHNPHTVAAYAKK